MSRRGGSPMPPRRWSASRTCACFCSSCVSYARSWKRQPPPAGGGAQGASTRGGPARAASGGNPLWGLALPLGDPRAPGVARQAAAHEDAVAVEPRDAVAAVGERLDLEL